MRHGLLATLLFLGACEADKPSPPDEVPADDTPYETDPEPCAELDCGDPECLPICDGDGDGFIDADLGGDD